jgi:hypothetical protein
MARDAKGWLKANSFYAGADLSLSCPFFHTVIITTKQSRFVEALLEHQGESTDKKGDNEAWGTDCKGRGTGYLTTVHGPAAPPGLQGKENRHASS